ncbi:MAG TPA: glucose-1-phosphate thymidylyltransferase [Thermoplasmata archaeon]|nr:glucose-1-phosphate thymidylyltransferase [Thermoplasmata archaeon]
MKGLLLAGGHGTRLRPLTFTGNKHMIPIANQPMLFYGLHHLADAGIREVAIVLGTIHEGIPEAVGDGAAFGLKVTYIHQGEPKGLAHAVACARSFLAEDPFVMYLGDNLLQDGARPLTEAFAARGGDAVIGVTPVADARQYGVVEMDGDRIVSIVEKPPAPRSNLALIGVYLFTPSIHPIIAALRPSARGELEITEAIWQLHRSGGNVRVQRVQGWWKDTGRPRDLLEANAKVLRSAGTSRFVREGRVDPGAMLVGSVGIGAGSTVGADCRIDGPVVLGKGVRVEGGAQIGPCTAVGDRSVIRGVTLEGSIVLEGAVLDGRFHLQDSIVGRDTEIVGGATDQQAVSCVLGDAGRVRLGAATGGPP